MRPSGTGSYDHGRVAILSSGSREPCPAKLRDEISVDVVCSFCGCKSSEYQLAGSRAAHRKLSQSTSRRSAQHHRTPDQSGSQRHLETEVINCPALSTVHRAVKMHIEMSNTSITGLSSQQDGKSRGHAGSTMQPRITITVEERGGGFPGRYRINSPQSGTAAGTWPHSYPYQYISTHRLSGRIHPGRSIRGQVYGRQSRPAGSRGIRLWSASTSMLPLQWMGKGRPADPNWK